MEIATCGGWRSYSKRILLQSSILLGIDLEQRTNFNNEDLCGLSAPKVPLKNSAKLRFTSRIWRSQMNRRAVASSRLLKTIGRSPIQNDLKLEPIDPWP